MDPVRKSSERIDVTRRTQRRRETHVDPYESVADLNKTVVHTFRNDQS